MTHSAPFIARLSRRGFTLIELLVVVGIISMLATIAIPNFMEAQLRTKVSRMKSDMRTISVAVESYAVDHGHYPMRRSITTMQNIIGINDTGSNNNNNQNNDGGVPFTPDKSVVWASEGEGFFWLSGVAKSLPEKTNDVNASGGASNTEFTNMQARQLAALTTPIGYMNTLYVDMFENRSMTPNNLLDYWDPVQTMWFINTAPTIKDTIGGEGLNLGSRAIRTPKEAGYMIVSVGPDGFIGHFNQYASEQGWPRTSNPHGVLSMYRPYDPSNGSQSVGNIYLNPKMGGLDGVPQRLTELKPLAMDYPH